MNKQCKKGSQEWIQAEGYHKIHALNNPSLASIGGVWIENNVLCVCYKDDHGNILGWWHYRIDNGKLIWW